MRDPIHGLIVFQAEGDDAARDQIAWQLLNTPEMQRLRRIRQLGVSEFTFPGATHSRFAHSLGVFHVARQLVHILKKLLPSASWSGDRAEVAVYAALLHDVGHGPFSHAFERLQTNRGVGKHHEAWTAEFIVATSGKIAPILEGRRRGMAAEVADLLRADVPQDVYHAIVSSSFDADRLDYLRRDRLMTGSGAGAIDFDWLLNSLEIADIPVGSDDDETPDNVATFCLNRKALQAAESFILARYHLFEQVYLHKTTRGMETIIEKFLGIVAEAAITGEAERIGLNERDPLVRFFGSNGGTLEAYLVLDDTAVWAAASRVASGEDDLGRRIARRLLDRERLYCLDVESRYPRMEGEDVFQAEGRWRELVERIDAAAAGDPTVVKDVVTNSAYGEIGADQAKAHKRLAIVVDEGPPREITALSDLIRALPRREIVRFYFETEAARRRLMEGL